MTENKDNILSITDLKIQNKNSEELFSIKVMGTPSEVGDLINFIADSEYNVVVKNGISFILLSKENAK